MNDAVLDDDMLLKDRLLRSFHRDANGHLYISARNHAQGIQPEHNVAILYIYLKDKDDVYTMIERYVYSQHPQTYKGWLALVYNDIQLIQEQPPADWLGVYGWHTNYLMFTPMRTGDLFICVDKEGVKGVRLSFDTTKVHRKARHEKK